MSAAGGGRFAGRHVIVTGGSSGIGKATAALFAAGGAAVTIIARREAVLASAAAEIEAGLSGAGLPGAPSGRVLALPADVSKRTDLTTAVETAVGAFGPPDVLVCCAGVARPGYFAEIPDEAFDEAMSTNYFGTLYAVRAVLDRMRARGRGHLVLVASGAALIGLFGYAAYGPSKFAVRGLAESLRAELAGTGVRVSVVYLPDVDTPQLAEENRTKPEELRAIAGNAKVWPARTAAELIVRGVERGSFVLAGSAAIRMLVHGHSVLGPVLRRYFDAVSRRAARKSHA